MKTPGAKIVEWFVNSKYEGNVHNGTCSMTGKNAAYTALANRIDAALARNSKRAKNEGEKKK